MGDSGMQRQSKRILGTGFSMAITVGGIIGLGILCTPGIIAEVTADPFLFLLLWVLGSFMVSIVRKKSQDIYGRLP